MWAAYHERLHCESKTFDAADDALYTIETVLEQKYSAEARECTQTKLWFHEILDKTLSELSYDDLCARAQKSLNTKIKVRGAKNRAETGIHKTPALQTVIRKHQYVSAAINSLNKRGANLTNHFQSVITHLRQLEKEQKKNTNE